MVEPTTEEEFLASYDIHQYQVPLTTVDIAIFTMRQSELQVLLVKRAQFPAKGQWALPGGFIDIALDGSLVDAASRKLFEKTGVKSPYLEQVGSFGSAKRDPRGWSVTICYFALLSSEDIILQSDFSSESVEWAPVDDIDKGEVSLAFDHNHILSECKDRLVSKVQYTALPVHLLPKDFTLSDLQRVYEALLGKPVEKKSFRRRILDADILCETGEMRKGGSRPAKVYRLKEGIENHFFPRTIEGKREAAVS